MRFRGGLVFKAHRLLYHSTLGLRVINKKTWGGRRTRAQHADTAAAVCTREGRCEVCSCEICSTTRTPPRLSAHQTPTDHSAATGAVLARISGRVSRILACFPCANQLLTDGGAAHARAPRGHRRRCLHTKGGKGEAHHAHTDAPLCAPHTSRPGTVQGPSRVSKFDYAS